MNTKLFLPRKKLTHKRINVKGDSSFHRTPKPTRQKSDPAETKPNHLAVLTIRNTLHLCTSHHSQCCAYLPDFFHIGNGGLSELGDRLKSPHIARPYSHASPPAFGRREQLPTPLQIFMSCALNPQEFRKILEEDASNILKVLH